MERRCTQTVFLEHEQFLLTNFRTFNRSQHFDPYQGRLYLGYKLGMHHIKVHANSYENLDAVPTASDCDFSLVKHAR